jgi:MFS family permease
MAAFSDRTGPLNMHIVSQILSSLLCMVLWSLAGSTSAAIAFCVLFGMTSGAVIGLPPASMANILSGTYNTPEHKHLSHSKLGQWTGMMYSMAAIPSLVGPVVAGHLVTKYNTYITVQMWAGANLMVSAVCMLVCRWYLPCYDGERVGAKIARMMNGSTMSEKGKGTESDSETEFGRGLSQAPTAVQSPSVSEERVNEKRKGSDNAV